jgi:hypothetical protein
MVRLSQSHETVVLGDYKPVYDQTPYLWEGYCRLKRNIGGPNIYIFHKEILHEK